MNSLYGFRLFLVGICLTTATGASAQGFQLQQHEPSAAGDGFFEVSRPWYANRGLAMGLSLNYGKNPLLGGSYDRDGGFRYDRTVISDQLAMHLGISGAVLDRVQLSLSAPLLLLERGAGGFGVTPNGGMQIGDPRLGAMVRLFDAGGAANLTLSAGGEVWVPTGAASAHFGDEGWRGALRLVADGTAGSRIRWAVNGGVLLRGEASLNDVPNGPGTTGSAVQLATGAHWNDAQGRLGVGPELVFATALDERALKPEGTRLELLLGGRYKLTETVSVGPAVGVGLVRSPGTPAFRALLRMESAFGAGARKVEAQPAQIAATTESVVRREPEIAEANEPVIQPEPEPEPAPAQEVVAVAAVEEAPEEPRTEQVAAVVPASSTRAMAPVGELPPTIREGVHVIHFATDAYELSERNRAFLDRVVRSLRARESRIVIDGHGDSMGEDSWNRTLSSLRADAVRQYLVARGVKGTRIEITGHGSSIPQAGNDSKQGRSQNRRVEIRSKQ